MERRFLATEVRGVSAAKSNSPGRLVGVAAVYNSLSQDLGGFKEQLAVGCFDRSLGSNPDVKCLFNHDPNLILGRTTSGTLKLWTDTLGLRMACDLPDTQLGRDLWVSIKRADVSEMSFAFVCQDQEWNDKSDPIVRTIRQADLLDVSAVVSPAYKATSISAREADCDEEDDDECEMYSRKLFPTGVPVEITSHVPNLRNINRAEARRAFVNKVLGI